MKRKKLLSVVVPVYNESENVSLLLAKLTMILKKTSVRYEVIFVDDGSADDSVKKIERLKRKYRSIKLIELSRNYGKEIATSAGLNACRGDAAIMIDADLQHPVELIPEFIRLWQRGAEVVIGVRTDYEKMQIIKRARSWLFYKILNSMAETKLTQNATDFRLIDRCVIDEFNRFTERNRITRGLIDWLGFKRELIYFSAGERANGKARYSTIKLIRLAVNSFVSLSLVPLKVAGYLGIAIMLFSGITGLFMLTERYVFNDFMNLHTSATSSLAMMIIFLVGIILSCLGLMALYIANIHDEVVNRPLYAVRKVRKKQP